MNKSEILKSITEWQAHQKALDAQLELLYNMTGNSGESPLMEAIYNIAGAHTDAVAALIGDESKWLDWWKYECRFGEKLMSAAKAGGKLRPVKTLKQLAGLIAE